MKPEEAAKVREMIASRPEFRAIKMIVNSDRETYDPSLAKQILEESVLVTFMIPPEGEDVYMPVFYGEMYKALNQESPVVTQRGTER